MGVLTYDIVESMLYYYVSLIDILHESLFMFYKCLDNSWIYCRDIVSSSNTLKY